MKGINRKIGNLILSEHRFEKNSFDIEDLFYKPLNFDIEENTILNNIFNLDINKYRICSEEESSLIDYDCTQVVYTFDFDYSKENLNTLLTDLFSAYRKKYTFGNINSFYREYLKPTINEIFDICLYTEFIRILELDNYYLYAIYFENNPFKNDQYWFLTKDKDLLNTIHKLKSIENELRSFRLGGFIERESNEQIDLLTERQKNIIDTLVEKGFKDVHIYRFLRDEKQFITITEKEFNNFMIDRYKRTYKPNKRITSINEISIPQELRMYFVEITS